MEGVGARLGRSSTRYGPATVFTGPVRRWKKKWIHVSPSSTGANNNNNKSQNQSSTTNCTSNGDNGPNLVLFKWTPIFQTQNNNDSSKEDDVAEPDEPPRRKFKYIPIAVLEEQEREAAEIEAAENVDEEAKPSEAAENVDEEAKPSETDCSVAEPTSRNDDFDENPDINDIPMEENEEDNKMVRQDLNETMLDLSLGLTARDGESDNNHEQLERVGP